MSFQINVDSGVYEGQLNALLAQVNHMEDLKGRYEAQRAAAESAWGSEDPNLAKAQAICSSAIAAIDAKITAAKGGIDAIRGIMASSESLSAQATAGLDQAKASIDALLR